MCNRNQCRQRFLRIQLLLCRIFGKRFKIYSDCCAFSTGSRQADHYTRTAGKQYPQTLAGTDGTINGVGIAEIIHGFNGLRPELLPRQLAGLRPDMRNHGIGLRSRYAFVIMEGLHSAAIALPVLLHQ